MKICSKCILPQNFPGITFDSEGVCSYCLRSAEKKDLEDKKSAYRLKFESLINLYKGRGKFDAIMSYSGGKDSTFALALVVREFGLETLAVTVDNGFLPQQTSANISEVVRNLGVDHRIIKPDTGLLKKIFVGCAADSIFPPATLVRASTICTACMTLVKFITLRLAVEQKVPFVIFGWSPGQIPLASSIMKNNVPMTRSRQNALLKPLMELTGDEILDYFLGPAHYKNPQDFPYSVSPLAFWDYNENTILEDVRRWGWKSPPDLDANSTNCQLNSLANVLHKKKYGFHPYAFELAKLVREGYMTRLEALAKLNEPENEATIALVRDKLGLEADESLTTSGPR